jgi:hypothetical protein
MRHFPEVIMSEDSEQLREQFGHWGTHPRHSLEDWQHEVGEGYTRLGYWEWVASLLAVGADAPPVSLDNVTVEVTDRVLGLGDQFLEDWALDAVQGGSRDAEYEKRNTEWQTLRPLFATSPLLLNALRGIVEVGRTAESGLARHCAEIASQAIASIPHGA